MFRGRLGTNGEANGLDCPLASLLLANEPLALLILGWRWSLHGIVGVHFKLAELAIVDVSRA